MLDLKFLDILLTKEAKNSKIVSLDFQEQIVSRDNHLPGMLFSDLSACPKKRTPIRHEFSNPESDLTRELLLERGSLYPDIIGIFLKQ